MRTLLISLFIVSISFGGDFSYQSNVKTYKDNVGRVNVAGYVNRIASSIAQQLGQNKNFDNFEDTPIAIMSVVDMNDFKKTSPIVKRISENLIHEMHVRGYKVVDYKAMCKIDIDVNGDYVFSRAMEDLQNQRTIIYALTGTYSNYKDGMAINIRIIDIKTNIVLSTAQVFVPKKVLKNIDKMYTKNTWFSSPQVQTEKSNNSVMMKGSE
jgi:TolB-like protein